MNSVIRLTLNTTPEQQARLLALQQAFAQVCNALAPVVQQTRVWNRVALHHMAYKQLRERFPGMGSQMVCNAIYSVSRASRIVFQTPGSPLHHSKLAGKPLPLLHFTDSSPVYFDRHTLSIKEGLASMYTLDGRMRFQLLLAPEVEQAFHTRKLHEVVLQRGQGGAFELSFHFGPAEGQPAAEPAVESAPEADAANVASGAPPLTPSYLEIQETA